MCACVLLLVDCSVCTYHKLYCLPVAAVNDNSVFCTSEMPSVWFELICRILKTVAVFFFVCRTS